MTKSTPPNDRYTQRGVAQAIADKYRGRLWFDHKSHCWYAREGSDIYQQHRRKKCGFVLAMEFVRKEQSGMTPAEKRTTGNASFFQGVESILRQTLLEEPRS